jgi:hypothetical protein
MTGIPADENGAYMGMERLGDGGYRYWIQFGLDPPFAVGEMHEIPEYFLLRDVLPAGHIPGHPELDVDDGTRYHILDSINTMKTRIEEAASDAAERARPRGAANAAHT